MAKPHTEKQVAACKRNWHLAQILGSTLGVYQSTGRPDDDEDLQLITQALGRIRSRWRARRESGGGS
jgi:hypothetical protein